MDEASAKLIQMLKQGMFTGKIGPHAQSPDLPLLSQYSMRRDVGLNPQFRAESSHVKSTPGDTDGAIRRAIEEIKLKRIRD